LQGKGEEGTLTAIYSLGGSHDPGGVKLSDAELDAVLGAADDELLRHVQGWAHPDAALLAMMKCLTATTNPTIGPRHMVHGAVADRAIAIIEMRSVAWRLHSGLARLRDRFDALALALYTALSLPGCLDRTCLPVCGLLDGGRIRRASASGACAAWLAPRAKFPARRYRLPLINLIVAEVAPARLDHCRLSQLINQVREPVTALADELDELGVGTLGGELASLASDAEQLAALASRYCVATEVPARSATLASYLQCFHDGGAGDSLAGTLPRIRSIVAELRRFADPDRAGEVSTEDREKIMYNLDSLGEAVAPAYRDTQALLAAVDSALLQCPVDLLAQAEVDASGVDLSIVAVPAVEVLNGVIWTLETKWPEPLVPEIQRCLYEVCEGVFMVRSETDDQDSADGQFMAGHHQG
jgi:hypothetical protein